MDEKMNEMLDQMHEDANENQASEEIKGENQTVGEEAGNVPQATVKVVKDKSEIVKKVLIALICVVVIGASIGFGYFIAKNPADGSSANGTTVSETENNPSDNGDDNNSDDAEINGDGSDSGNDSNSENNDTNGNGSVNDENTTNKTTQSDSTLASKIIGAWTDNANLSGYEFLEGGIVKITYFNMSSINLEDVIDGTYTGTYTVNGDKLTISYTIYSKATTKEYTVDVNDNLLTMTASDGSKSVYVRKGTEAVVETEGDVDDELLGKWTSNLSGYEFKEKGVVSITYIDLSAMGINLDINGKVDGVYTVSGDTINIRFSIYSSVIEKDYTYSIDGRVLTLTDKESGEKGTYIKEVTDNES